MIVLDLIVGDPSPCKKQTRGQQCSNKLSVDLAVTRQWPCHSEIQNILRVGED